ncbi:low molecular weight protein-tyrosine-phosphatase [Oceanicoccus sp. KOV_DT_Chl]|uniref:low molecular weight protein-tyrosine-phosphatase n=1 Tax=Oceanicoccus sp. KOV_DT_Chl TaxID=1904639 RepID=UPI000C7DDC60|nr:low molecular weight protein-tyrosine-phosphatase [Oceanicoccus sp. KOV_DT_Chl]
MTINVLFVCLGNICRSPAAQGIFERLVSEKNLATSISVDSCGTAPFNVGKHPDPRSVAASARAGYDISQQIARQIDDQDYSTYNYIIAMDRANLTNVQAWAPSDYQGEINLLMHYSQRGGNRQIPDPYYDDEEQFDKVIVAIEKACRHLLSYIINKHELLHDK